MKNLHYYEIPILIKGEIKILTTYTFGYYDQFELAKHILRTAKGQIAKKAYNLLNFYGYRIYPEEPTVKKPETKSPVTFSFNDDDDKHCTSITHASEGQHWRYIVIRCPDLKREKEILELRKEIVELKRMLKQ
jgi:hypothetical protein